MDKLILHKLQNQFDALGHIVPDESVEFWFARELQEPLGYAKWDVSKTRSIEL
jgi:DNA-damage-inducible protein D